MQPQRSRGIHDGTQIMSPVPSEYGERDHDTLPSVKQNSDIKTESTLTSIANQVRKV